MAPINSDSSTHDLKEHSADSKKGGGACMLSNLDANAQIERADGISIH